MQIKYIIINSIITTLVCALLLLADAMHVPLHAAPLAYDKEIIDVKTANGTIQFEAELAKTSEQQEQGLMYRTTLAEKSGMLFYFDRSRIIYMWMKNTYIPLDMVFTNSKGIVVHIIHNATPKSEEILSSRVMARAVLELNGGAAKKYGIEMGDVIHAHYFTGSK